MKHTEISHWSRAIANRRWATLIAVVVLACRHAPPETPAPHTNCMSRGQLAAAAGHLGDPMDEKIRKKLESPLRLLYDDMVSASRRGFDRTAQPQDLPCIPERIVVTARFTGTLEDLKAAGLEQITVFTNRDGGVHYATGSIAAARIPELAAVPHVLFVTSSGDFGPVLNRSTQEIGAVTLHEPQAGVHVHVVSCRMLTAYQHRPSSLVRGSSCCRRRLAATSAAIARAGEHIPECGREDAFVLTQKRGVIRAEDTDGQDNGRYRHALQCSNDGHSGAQPFAPIRLRTLHGPPRVYATSSIAASSHVRSARATCLQAHSSGPRTRARSEMFVTDRDAIGRGTNGDDHGG